MRFRSALAAALVFSAALVTSIPSADAVSPDVVVSQVFGGGGNVGAPFSNDYIELFNRGTRSVDVSGWSVQYTTATGSNWLVTPLSGSIPGGGYFLVSESSGGTAGSSLPDADVSGSTAMSAAAGKVALSASATPLAGTAPSGGQLHDLVGYGSANGFEGSDAAPGLSSTSADLRVDGGCSDGDDNSTDFVSGSPNPRNSSSALNSCHDVVISQVFGGGGNAGAPYANDYVELFNRSTTSVDLSDWSVQYASPTGTAWSLTSLSGSIPAGGYFLVQEAGSGAFGTNLPAADSVGNVNIGSTAGKVALVSNGWGLAGNGPFGTGVRDFVGYGGANAFEGSVPSPSPANSTAIHRASQGCIDTDQNGTDFNVDGPVPRNSESSARTCGGAASAGTVSDFDGNGTTDLGVFRPSTGTWFVKDKSTTGWGTSGDVPVPGDYDGNGTTDDAVFRPSNGTWFVKDGPTMAFGAPADTPVPGDYDGNGTTDMAVFRPSTGTWFIKGGATTAWGTSGDIPVPGDYDGDGAADLAVFRPSNGTWFVKGGSTTKFGTSGDIPVPGDYDGDGAVDIAVFRPSSGTWFVKGGAVTVWGTSGDVPVPGDYDGDGTTDLAVFRPSNGMWFVKGGPTVAWGTKGDRPTPLPAAVWQAFIA
ncbi:MAG: lamin tail domain-containing protein [Actinomycetota bacterium]|nr:lamin tail domain-containing protein [Actinomycetota bacterium]